MAKHDFEPDTMTTHDIMHCTRVFRIGDRFDRVRVTPSRVGSFGFQDYWFSKARPTGAHRHETVPVDIATYIYATFVECVRNPTPGMMEFEFIYIPRV